MQCLPDNLKNRLYYHPTEEGLEKRIKTRLEEIKRAKAESARADAGRKREKPGA
jgi:putative ATPase